MDCHSRNSNVYNRTVDEVWALDYKPYFVIDQLNIKDMYTLVIALVLEQLIYSTQMP